jgi:predicted flavoprotein YhiN
MATSSISPEDQSKITIDLPPDVSADEVKKYLASLTRRKERKKQEEDPAARLAALKKQALKYIHTHYNKYVLMQEGIGYYIIAHTENYEVVVKFEKSVFQPRTEKINKEICTLSIIQYDKLNRDKIEPFLSMNCERRNIQESANEKRR